MTGMAAFPEKTGAAEQIRTMEGLPEAPVREEREIYPETHSTKANGYYTHNF